MGTRLRQGMLARPGSAVAYGRCCATLPTDLLCRPLLPLVQAQLLLPAGEGLVQLEAQLHHDSIQLHSYALAPPEERLAAVLQQHLLGVSASSRACAAGN